MKTCVNAWRAAEPDLGSMSGCRSFRPLADRAGWTWRKFARYRRFRGALAAGLSGRRIQILLGLDHQNAANAGRPVPTKPFDLRAHSEKQAGRGGRGEQDCPRLDRGKAVFLEQSIFIQTRTHMVVIG